VNDRDFSFTTKKFYGLEVRTKFTKLFKLVVCSTPTMKKPTYSILMQAGHIGPTAHKTPLL